MESVIYSHLFAVANGPIISVCDGKLVVKENKKEEKMSENICRLHQKEFISAVTLNHHVALSDKHLQPKTVNAGNCCDETPTVASNSTLIPELNQKKVYKKYSAKNETKVK